MAEQGASRADIEQEMTRMQQGAAPAPQPAPQKPAAQRIIPTSRPRYTDAERQAHRKKRSVDFCHRQEVQDVIQQIKSMKLRII